MPRRPRLAAGDLAYHVLNRRVGRLPLFGTPADYAARTNGREQSAPPIHAHSRYRPCDIALRFALHLRDATTCCEYVHSR